VIFHSYVKLPEGRSILINILPPFHESPAGPSGTAAQPRERMASFTSSNFLEKLRRPWGFVEGLVDFAG